MESQGSSGGRLKKTSAPSRAAGQLNPEALKVIDYFVSLFPERAISARCPESVRMVSKRLEEFTAQDLMRAALGLSLKAFNVQKGLTATRYVYGDAEKVENFILCAKNPEGANASPDEIEKRVTRRIKEQEHIERWENEENIWAE